MIEIERKFLVLSNQYRKTSHRKTRIIQGYLSKDLERTVRVRIRDDQGFLTIKGISTDGGLSRFEWEKEIPLKDAKELMSICLPEIIEKTRYEVNFKGFLFEIDEFEGVYKNLIVAEVELKSTKDKIVLPEWIGKEVTGEKKYYNSHLSEKK